jgi:ubiquinone/menaquinone biosynthesis C-methylase UbiE
MAPVKGLGARRRDRDESASPEQLQHDFYTANADQYDEDFLAEGDEHYIALDFVSALIDGYGYKSVLDVGTGTGRGVKHFLDRHPDLEVKGIEPVKALLEQAERKGIPSDSLIEGRGDQMPFEDGAFDVVCEFGILHHVADPVPILTEMTRVARRAIFLSDENRFANGGAAHRAAKYALHTVGLWPLAFRLRNRGHPYLLTAGDGGVAYSYSVYDSLEQLNEWADRTFFVPLIPAPPTRFHPLFGATNLLLCALRDR